MVNKAVNEAYQMAQLAFNPFRVVPADDPADDLPWAGDSELYDEIRRAAMDAMPGNLESTQFVVLNGSYGSGKTHIIKKMTRDLRNEDITVVFLRHCVFDDKPRWKHLVRQILNQEITKDIAIEKLSPLRQHLQNLARKKAESENQNANQDEIREKSKNQLEGLYEKVLPECPSFVRLLMAMCDASNTTESDKIWAYLSKERANGIDQDYSGVPTGLANDYDATLILAYFAKVLTYSDIENSYSSASPVFCIFIDELEDMGPGNMDAQGRRSINQGLRDFLNTCVDKTFVGLSFGTSDVGEVWSILDNAVLQRTTRQIYEVAQLEENESESFVLQLLELARLDSYEGTPEWPFTAEGLKAFVANCPPPLTRRKINCSATNILFSKYREKVAMGEGVDADDVASFRDWCN